MSGLVVIGNGIAGITTARHVRKRSDMPITVISEETDHFFSRTALMYIYMGHMKYENTKPYEDWFWDKNKISLARETVISVDTSSKRVICKSGKTISYDHLVLATGSLPNKFGWPGQDLKGVQGLYSYQDLESMEHYSQGLKRAVVVGGGLIGIEMAEMFASRQIPVTFLVREQEFWRSVLPKEESLMVGRHINEHHIDLRLGAELDEIIGDEQGRVKAVKTKNGKTIDCQFVGLTVGVRPNIEFLKDSGIELDRGILKNEFQETSVPDIYAVGDCSQHRTPPAGRRPLEQIWYTGKIQGEVCAKNICGKRVTYEPGVFFNSAKFFDIEYQTYGTVPANLPEGYSTLYWEHPDGRKSVRINYESSSGKVTGFNLMGIRYRHKVCEHWLLTGANIRTVLEELGMANFDPELFSKYEKELISLYNSQNPEKSVTLQEAGSSFLSKFF